MSQVDTACLWRVCGLVTQTKNVMFHYFSLYALSSNMEDDNPVKVDYVLAGFSCKVDTKSFEITHKGSFLKDCLLKENSDIYLSFLGIFYRCSWRFPLIGFYFLDITLEGFVKYWIIFPFPIIVTIQATHLTWKFILVKVNINLEQKPISV